MKNTYQEYKNFTEEEYKEISKKALIVFDANALLNLYRLSEQTSSLILQGMENVKDRVWLPYHAGKEFFTNRRSVIYQKMKEFDDLDITYSKVLEPIRSERKASVSQEIKIEIEALQAKIKKEVEARKERLKGLLSKDTILDKLHELFEGKIGDRITDKKYAELEKEGARRYEKAIPPGFKDKTKTDNKFGDYIIWSEMIDRIEKDRPLIFVSGDTKPDWQLEEGGEKCGAHPALRAELIIVKNSDFVIYSSSRFVKFFSESTKEEVEVAAEEIESLPKNRARIRLFDDSLNDYDILINSLNKQLICKNQSQGKILDALETKHKKLMSLSLTLHDTISSYMVSSETFFNFSDKLLDFIVVKTPDKFRIGYINQTINAAYAVTFEIRKVENSPSLDKEILISVVQEIIFTLRELKQHISNLKHSK